MSGKQAGLLGKLTDGKVSRQEPVLQEAAARIRRYAKLRQTEKHNRPLIVILACSPFSGPVAMRVSTARRGEERLDIDEATEASQSRG
jgi:hypothetical protein